MIFDFWMQSCFLAPLKLLGCCPNSLRLSSFMSSFENHCPLTTSIMGAQSNGASSGLYGRCGEVVSPSVVIDCPIFELLCQFAFLCKLFILRYCLALSFHNVLMKIELRHSWCHWAWILQRVSFLPELSCHHFSSWMCSFKSLFFFQRVMVESHRFPSFLLMLKMVFIHVA